MFKILHDFQMFFSAIFSLWWVESSGDRPSKVKLTELKCILFYLLCRPAPKNEDEMMIAIFEYIDRSV
jgi:hypothetical protein